MLALWQPHQVALSVNPELDAASTVLTCVILMLLQLNQLVTLVVN